MLSRMLVIAGVLIVLLVPLAVRFYDGQGIVEIHGRMAETGGWSPSAIKAQVGVPLHLRLTSDDVMHGFAIGQSEMAAVDVPPGKMTELTLTFDKPGTYTYYCTRWCGLNHWRMRGTIEVTSDGLGAPQPVSPPLYVTLNLDIDAPHPAPVTPLERPSALRGAAFTALLPPSYLTTDYYRSYSPAQAFNDLRSDPALKSLNNAQLWDIVAFIWQSNTTPEGLAAGKQLFAQNCAACHGENGAGNGVFADKLAAAGEKSSEDMTGAKGMQMKKPVNFTDPANMLGASPALLLGKTIRGGMGTGMPMWGSIFTDEKTWNIIAYLYSFHFTEVTK